MRFKAAPDYENPRGIHKAKPDKAKANVYELELTATDKDGNAGKKVVLVSVANVADETAPRITSPATATVAENTTGLVYTATAADDASAAADIRLLLPARTKDNDLFTITGSDIAFRKAPDFEAPHDKDNNNRYELQLRAVDEAGNVAVKAVQITVTDMTTEPPTITSPAVVRIAENSPAGTTVYTATATDDVSAAADISFSLASGVKDNDLFTLTGANVTFKTPPDYENPQGINKAKPDKAKANVYELQLAATDAANNAAIKLIRIIVTDVSDPTYKETYTNMDFVLVEKGSFTMGCTSEQGADCGGDESPAHQVSLTKDYYLGKYEVTQAQWRQVMGSNPSGFTSPACDNCPVEKVSWNDIQAFLKRLNAEFKQHHPGTKQKFRLPTEAEWEYAARARAATATKYAGTTGTGSNTIGDVAWYSSNATAKTHPVGQKTANALGLHDMSGNAWEWCADWYGNYSATDKTDPAGAETGTNRVLRGGAWNSSATFCRVTYRNHAAATYSDNSYGFRLLLEAKDKIPPVITSPANAQVPERSSGFIYTATATDNLSTNPEISFSLAAGVKENDFFSLSGAGIRFKNLPEYNTATDANANVYGLELTATDADHNLSTKEISITVTRLPDDTPPVITSPTGASVVENATGTGSPVTTVLYTATAVDDTSEEAEIRFSLPAGAKDNDLFALSGNKLSFNTAYGGTGTLPDYENPADADGNNLYELKLTATDKAGNVALKWLRITVTNVAVEAPTITSPATVEVAENTTGTVYTATATDDVSTAAEITFSLASGVEDNDLFTLTGNKLSFKATPDFEKAHDKDKNNLYELELTATDAAGNAGTKVVSITVTNVDEPTYTDAHTNMPFVKVEKGTFTMGCTSEQGSNCWTNGKPAHQVTLTNDYYMGKYEVTQAQWVRVMGSNPSHFTSPKCDNCPVESVSWNDVQGFLTKLNAELVKNNPAEQRRYRLPTEAEWEYAARGGQNATATKYAGSNTLGDVAWYYHNSAVSGTRKTHAVGGKAANELGLYDMSGNVWEWCSDWYGGYSSEAKTDPKGPSSGIYRVLRGGSWGDYAGSCRVSNRSNDGFPGRRTNYNGFRLCLSGDKTPPVITSAATAEVEENTIGTAYTARATDNISTAAEITFSLAAGVEDNDLFTLTGNYLIFKAAPDYEKPQVPNKNNWYEIELTATDRAGNASKKQVIITVTENDYFDTFTRMPFVEVKAGTFTMGCTSEQSSCYSDESPTHSVTLTKDYYMGKYEVTQAQWVRVMGSNPSYFTNPACDNCPVEQVSWNDIQNFITKLNAELVKNSPSEQRRYRLPTEAEWEYAARGGQSATATKYAGSSSIGGVAWYYNNSSVNGTRKTHPVGGKAANELGLYDMTGNVLEWCADSQRNYTSTAVTDPKGPSSGRRRVLRGGSWLFYPRFCRVSYRGRVAPPDSRSYNYGFRLCLSL